MRKLALIVAATLLLVGSVAGFPGFDGKRSGLIVGGGIGFSPVVSWESGSDNPSDGANHSGLGGYGMFGFGIGQRNVFVTDFTFTSYSSPERYYPYESVAHVQWESGVSWYHYYGQTGRSVFTMFGAGLCALSSSGRGRSGVGGAITLGGGYEFARHFQVGLYYVAGESIEFNLFGNGDNGDHGCHQLNLLVTVMAY